MILANTAATGMPLAILAYTPGRPLALQTLGPTVGSLSKKNNSREKTHTTRVSHNRFINRSCSFDDSGFRKVPMHYAGTGTNTGKLEHTLETEHSF